jgi:hypothetical protein
MGRILALCEWDTDQSISSNFILQTATKHWEKTRRPDERNNTWQYQEKRNVWKNTLTRREEKTSMYIVYVIYAR